MAKFYGAGEPTRKSTGSIGDIYTDKSSGKQYECVFSYRDNTDDEFLTQWRELKTGDKSEKIPGKEIQEKHSETVKEEKVTAEEPVDNNPVGNSANRMRANYQQYGKNVKNNK